MINASSKIIFNPQRIRKDGTVLLYLRVIISREKKDIDLKIVWPCERFDLKNQKCLPRTKEDALCEDYNLILKNELAKATEILVRYRLRRMDITLDLFLKEYRSQISTEDFYQYFEKKINLRYRTGEITDPTRNNHLGTLRKLKEWKPNLSFSELDAKTAKNFDSWMLRKTKCKTLNGRACHHKNFKTYVRTAIEQDEIQCVNPYVFFKAKTEMGRSRDFSKSSGKRKPDQIGRVFCCFLKRISDNHRIIFVFDQHDFNDFRSYLL